MNARLRLSVVVLVSLVAATVSPTRGAHALGFNTGMLYRYPWDGGVTMTRTTGWGGRALLAMMAIGLAHLDRLRMRGEDTQQDQVARRSAVMGRIPAGVTALLILLAAGVAACGNPQTADEQTQTAEAGTPAGTQSETPLATDTASPAATGTPGETPTPIPISGTPEPATLTDTGYKALDGRPLYAECIQAGAPMPPEIPTPAATQIPPPTIDPSIDPNEGKPTPAPSGLPSFDLRTIAPGDTAGWAVRYSNCYGYSMALPPDWQVSPRFLNAGYQQGEDATLRAPDGRSKIEIGVYYTPVDQLARAHQVSLGQGEYQLDVPRDATRDGRPGVVHYLLERGDLTGVLLSYMYAPRPDWYVSIGIWLAAPFDSAAAMTARAVADSLHFP